MVNNLSEDGWWDRIADAAEALGGTTVDANPGRAGQLRRVAIGLEGFAETQAGIPAQLVSKVQHAATRTALAALPTDNPAAYLRETGREGDFVFDSSNLSAQVTADTAQGIYVAPSSDTTGASGAWVRKFDGPATITPYMFGAGGGYDTVSDALAGIDDTTAIQAMLSCWKAYPNTIPSFQNKYWTISSEITIQQTASTVNSSNPKIIYGGTFVGKTGSAGTRAVTINFPAGHIKGHIGFIGPGDASGNCINYAARSWDYGLYVVDSYSLRIDSWSVANVKCWGLEMATENFANLGTRTNTGGLNIGVRIGPGNFYNCGSAAGQVNTSRLQYVFDSVTYNGGSAAFNQTCTVHFTTALDPKIDTSSCFTYTDGAGNRWARAVKTVDLVANTIEFYQWLPGAVTAGTMDSAHGGGLHIHGPNSGMGKYGPAVGIRAGVGVQDSGLYGSDVGTIEVEASGLGHVIGSPPNGVSLGGSTEGLHVESTFLMLVSRTVTPTGRTLGPVSGNGKGDFPYGNTGFFSQFHHCAPLYSSDQPGFIGQSALITSDGFGAVLQNEGGPTQFDVGATAITISNRPHERQYMGSLPASGSTPTVTLNWYDEYSTRWTGKNWMGFNLFGSAFGRNAVSQVTVQLNASLVTAGWTLNGGTAAIVYTSLRGPCRGTVIVDRKAKTFKLITEGLESQLVQGVTTNGDVALTLAPETAKKTQIWNTPLTANRAVTLSATNAKEGDYFEIVRTAAATGAFNLNIGTGPLKALAAGQWCKVVYDGTAWQLTMFGSL